MGIGNRVGDVVKKVRLVNPFVELDSSTHELPGVYRGVGLFPFFKHWKGLGNIAMITGKI